MTRGDFGIICTDDESPVNWDITSNPRSWVLLFATHAWIDFSGGQKDSIRLPYEDRTVVFMRFKNTTWMMD